MDNEELEVPRLLFVNLDDYVPKDHLLRLIRERVDFKFIYDRVRHLYKEGGRPSINPVTFMKMLLIGYIYGIPSERRLEQEVSLNIAYRWFLGIQLDERVPDHSTLSANRNGRFAGTTIFRDIFEEIVEQCKKAGLIEGGVVVTDSTHIKANVADYKREVVKVTKTPSQYWIELEQAADEIEQEKGHDKGGGGRGSGPSQDELKETTRLQSTTDPDAGILGRPGKPYGFHFLAHLTVDPSHGIILDAETTPADTADSTPYIECIRRVKKRYDIREAVADAGYDSSMVHRGLDELGVTGYIASFTRRSGYKTPGLFAFKDFVYETETDTYRCPFGKQLHFTHIKRSKLRRVYAAKTSDCRECPLRSRCLSPSVNRRVVDRALFQDYADAAHDRIGTPHYYELQRLRRIWSEGTFATLKARHCLGRAIRRGLDKMSEQVLMASTALNLVRLARARI